MKFSGRIAPVENRELAFSSDGRVAQVSVRRGDAVAKGQLLAELESGQSGFELRRAQANLKIAQLRLELTLIQNPPTSEAARLTTAIQEQEVELAQIALDELNTAYESVRLSSPIDGTVFSVSITDGTTVEANQTVIVVANLNNLIVSADLNSDDMARLTVGMKVSVDAIGRNIPTVDGVVHSLPYPYGSTDAELAGNSVQVVLNESPGKLGYKVGDLVNLTIILEKKTDALWLPSQAVRDFEGRYFAILQEGETQRRVDVKVGIIETDRIEITEGLAEGQVVIAP